MDGSEVEKNWDNCFFCNQLLTYICFTGVGLYSELLYCMFCKLKPFNEISKVEYWFLNGKFTVKIISTDILHSFYYPRTKCLNIFSSLGESIYYDQNVISDTEQLWLIKNI